jgi:hypothetical protein
MDLIALAAWRETINQQVLSAAQLNEFTVNVLHASLTECNAS